HDNDSHFCHPERERGTWAGGGAQLEPRATHPPGPSLTLLMTRPSSALRAPSPRVRGEGEQVTRLRSVTPRPAERGEGDTKRSGVRVRGVSFAASSAHRAGPSL